MNTSIEKNYEHFEQLGYYFPLIKDKAILIYNGDANEIERLLGVSSNLTIVDSNASKLESLAQQSNFQNLRFLNKGASDFDLSGQKYDFIFLSSIFDQVKDEQAISIVEECLKSLNLGGYFLFRELLRYSKEEKNPKYFIDLLEARIVKNEANELVSFDLVYVRPDKNSGSNNNVPTELTYFYTKIKAGDYHGFATLQEFLDHKQYSLNGILRYEKIFGEGFVSTGGIETTKQFLKEIGLKKNQKVLDVGCGIGGGNFIMAQEYGVDVLGIDLSSNMIGVAWDRAQKFTNLKSNVQFEIGDCMKISFKSNMFDVIYSRDTLLHLHDKNTLFSKFKDWLKPGGKIFISDYCCGEKPWSSRFEEYVKSRGYDLHTPKAYGQIFADLGFVNVKARDTTDMFVDCLKKELAQLAKIKDEFVKEFSIEDYHYLVDGWNAKLERCSKGDQKWGVISCEKSL